MRTISNKRKSDIGLKQAVIYWIIAIVSIIVASVYLKFVYDTEAQEQASSGAQSYTSSVVDQETEN